MSIDPAALASFFTLKVNRKEICFTWFLRSVQHKKRPTTFTKITLFFWEKRVIRVPWLWWLFSGDSFSFLFRSGCLPVTTTDTEKAYPGLLSPGRLDSTIKWIQTVTCKWLRTEQLPVFLILNHKPKCV